MDLGHILRVKILRGNAGAKFINISLRGAASLGKFLLWLWLAKNLNPADVGEFALLSVTIAYSLLIVGMDFYSYSSREIMGSTNKSDQLTYAYNQSILYLLLHFIFLPIASLVFYFNVFPSKLFLYFIILLVLEHACQEVDRLLVSLSKPLTSTLVFFLRSGVWCYLLMLFVSIDPSLGDLKFVYLAWICGSFTGFAVGLYFIFSYFAGERTVEIKREWIIKGVKVAIPFLVITLSLRGMSTIDRYFVDWFEGQALLGVYSLFWGIIGVIQVAIHSGVVVFYYPKLVALYKNRKNSDYVKAYRAYSLAVNSVTTISCILLAVAIHPVLSYIDKPLYSESINLFYLALVAGLLFNLSLAPHSYLYTRGLDSYLIKSTLASFLIALTCLTGLTPLLGAEGVSIGLIIAFAYLLASKHVAVYKDQRKYSLNIKTVTVGVDDV